MHKQTENSRNFILLLQQENKIWPLLIRNVSAMNKIGFRINLNTHRYACTVDSLFFFRGDTVLYLEKVIEKNSGMPVHPPAKLN